MIFAIAANFGLVAGLIRARMKSSAYLPSGLKYLWIILVSFIPQWLVFFLPATRQVISDQWVPFFLIGSLLVLIAFVWLNRRQPGIWLMGLGLVLNLVVICLNNGWMPISPETLDQLLVSSSTWQLWQRHGFSKDMVIPINETRAWILSDVFRINFLHIYKVAFSFGDILVASGIYAYLWSAGESKTLRKEYVK
jgi:hypothetical protein